MAKFISVLNARLGLPYWEAVQWNDDLTALTNNPLYSADVNLILPKNPGDNPLGTKTVTERNTGIQGEVTMFRLSTTSQNLLALSSSTATHKVIEELTKNIKKKPAL